VVLAWKISMVNYPLIATDLPPELLDISRTLISKGSERRNVIAGASCPQKRASGAANSGRTGRKTIEYCVGRRVVEGVVVG